jgi:peroxiredoxin
MLATDLETAAASFRNRLSPDQRRIFEHVSTWLETAGIAGGALKVGELAPDFALVDASGETVELSRLLDRGPVVIVFVCGRWCPLCSLTLDAYRAVAAEIMAAGASLLAISPERHDPLLPPAAAQPAFSILSDEAGRTARLFGVLYPLPGPVVEVYRALGIELAARNAGAGWQLPLPAVYGLDRDAIARLACVHADHARRPEPDALLAFVRGLIGSATPSAA